MYKTIKELLDSVTFTGEDITINYGGINEFYFQDKKRFDKAKKNSLKLLRELKPKYSELTLPCKIAFAGRLEQHATGYQYIPGQFYDIEVPQAVEQVLLEVKRQRN